MAGFTAKTSRRCRLRWASRAGCPRGDSRRSTSSRSSSCPIPRARNGATWTFAASTSRSSAHPLLRARTRGILGRAVAKGVDHSRLDDGAREPSGPRPRALLHRRAVDEHKFTALHGAFLSDGILVYVPRGVEVEVPL